MKITKKLNLLKQSLKFLDEENLFNYNLKNEKFKIFFSIYFNNFQLFYI